MLLVIIGVVVLSYTVNTTQIGRAERSGEVLAAIAPVTSSPLLQEINEYRAKAGVQPLTISDTNQSIADTRTGEIVDHFAYTHTRPSGGIFSDLFTQLPAQSCENLQLQQSTNIKEAVEAWMNSTGHRSCLLHPESRYAGISVNKLIDTSNGPSYIITYIGSSN